MYTGRILMSSSLILTSLVNGSTDFAMKRIIMPIIDYNTPRIR